MPALIHTSQTLDAQKLVLSSIGTNYAPTGLVEVSLQFSTVGDYLADALRLFYTDAPPPVWPDNVPADSLLSRALFMVSHSWSQENGLATISASYVGGLASNLVTPWKTTTRDSNKSESVTSGQITIQSVRNTETGIQVEEFTYTPFYSFTYARRAMEFRYVEVEGLSPVTITPPTAAELATLTDFSSSYYAVGADGAFVETPTPRSFFEGLIAAKTVQADFQYEYRTPSVRVVSERYFLS